MAAQGLRFEDSLKRAKVLSPVSPVDSVLLGRTRQGRREGEVVGPEYRDHSARVEKAEP